MIKFPSETLACSFHKTDKIVRDIEDYYIGSDNSQITPLFPNLETPVYVLTAGTGCKAKAFDIPLQVKLRGVEALIVDMRAHTAVTNQYSSRITNQAEFDTSGLLAALTSIWNSSQRGFIVGLCADVGVVYATWLSSTLGATFNMNPDQRTDISIIAALYYWSSITGIDMGLSKHMWDKTIGVIANTLKVDYDRVAKLSDELIDKEAIASLPVFIQCLKNFSGGVRLDGLDESLLFQATTGVWMGGSGRNIMQVAIEYPPYILGLVAMSLNNRTYKRCRFYEYVSLFDRRNEIKNIPLAIERLIHI